MSHIINALLRKAENLLSRTRIRLFKTAYVNFRTLPFKQAVKWPIFIYGRVKLYNLSGQIEIRGPVERGMIKFGYRKGYFSGPKGSAMLFLAQNAKLIFNGPCVFDYDYAIRITENGIVRIGTYCRFGNDTKIYCEENIEIGAFSRFPFGTCIMDTNYHYMMDLSSGTVHKQSSPIRIGAYNWIGNTSQIMKGTKTPDWCTVASKSFLNKDYTQSNQENVLIAGHPAKIIKENYVRIFSFDAEQRIKKWFEQFPNQTYRNEELIQTYKDMASVMRAYRPNHTHTKR